MIKKQTLPREDLMRARELKQKYLSYFVEKGHKKLPNVSLLPENDPSALFISAGMHPLVPYLLGEPHPQGKRLTSLQRCLRTSDIEEVGNPTHNSFFEMLGNWSLGDYGKKEAIFFSFEFLKTKLKISPERLFITCFAGNKKVGKDEVSASFWRSLGISSSRIFFLGEEDNWWGPVGETGPCGPDTEVFVDTGKPVCSLKCRPGCPCGKYFEIWNNVFMEYEKTAEGNLKSLKQKNVDTGMGVERTTAILQRKDDIYKTELFWPIIEKIEEASSCQYTGENKRPMRIMADHLKAATFLIVDGVLPSNKDQGYVLRRFLRRAAVKMYELKKGALEPLAFQAITQTVLSIKDYQESYFDLDKDLLLVKQVVKTEIEKFSQTLARGLCRIEKIGRFNGRIAFDLYQTYGFPFEISQELASQRGQKIKKENFDKEFARHQSFSRVGALKKFAGGLVDHSQEVTKLHTATHLLHQALRQVLGSQAVQKGSNITAERLRFDFAWPRKLASSQIAKIERMVNQKIKENLPVQMEIMSLSGARKKGAIGLFGQKYAEKVKTYRIGEEKRPFSFEICGGPHVDFTGTLGKFKIIKEESAGYNTRRIYATLSYNQ